LCAANCCWRLACASLALLRDERGTLNCLLQNSHMAIAGVVRSHLTTRRTRFGIDQFLTGSSRLPMRHEAATLNFTNHGAKITFSRKRPKRHTPASNAPANSSPMQSRTASQEHVPRLLRPSSVWSTAVPH